MQEERQTNLIGAYAIRVIADAVKCWHLLVEHVL